jgi:glycosyltransferase involved in cell wall biosynthesis
MQLKTNVTVSAIIPTYNRRDLIVAAVESASAQTVGGLEIIVVNDGSTDDTAAVLRPWVRSGRIRYLEQPNGGHGAARNYGVANATGEFVAFLDDDDFWPPDTLRWQAALLRDNPNWVAVGGGVRASYPGGNWAEAKPAKPTRITTDSIFRSCPFWSPGQVMIRRAPLMQCGGFDQKIWGADDLDLYFRLERLGEMHIYPEVALHYRVHGSNESANRVRMFRNCLGVLSAHLRAAPASRRARYRRDSYRGLYEYVGRQWIGESKGAARRGDLAGIARIVRNMAPLLGAAVRDPCLVNWMIRDALPVRLLRTTMGSRTL